VNTFAAKDTQEKVIYDSMARTGRYIDVGVSDVDKRLAPLFEFLQQGSRCSRLGGDSTVAVGDARTDFLDLLVRTVKDTLEATRGGFHDADALVFDALFFAWTSTLPEVSAPRDPFSMRSKWKLSTEQFVAAVKGSGLDAELRRKLRGVPDHVHLKLVAKLLGKFESSPLVNGTDLVIEEALICSDEHADVVTNLTCDGLDRERRLSDCLRLDPSSSENEISHAMETVQHVACDRSGSVELAVSMVLCSNRLQCLRDAALRRQYDGARDAAERELIAALNRMGGHSQDGVAIGAQSLAPALVCSLILSPEKTLSRLVCVASEHASQTPLLLSALSAQPGISRMQSKGVAIPLILEQLSATLRRAPAELGSTNHLSGLMGFIAALCTGEDCPPGEHFSGLFGERLVKPRRSHLEQRQLLLFIVLPVLCHDGEVSAGLEFGALQLLHLLLTGAESQLSDLKDISLSQRGVELLRATFPGSILFGLGRFMDRGVNKSSDMCRDLACSILRSCVAALRTSLSRSHRGTPSMVASVALADANAGGRLTWRTRMLMEPLFASIRKSHPKPKRSPPAAQISGRSGAVAAFSDLIALCGAQFFEPDDLVEQWRGHQQPSESLREVFESVSLSKLESQTFQLRQALLEACAITLPTCTLFEFEVVVQRFLRRALCAVSESGTLEDLASQPMIIDFLTRVLLLQMSINGVGRESETLSRQLATVAVNVDGWALPSLTGGDAYVVSSIAVTFRSLECLSVALLQTVKMFSSKTQTILLNATLRLIGKLCGRPLQMEREVEEIFHTFPEGECKQHIIAACRADVG